jgi:hypothetical protein
MKKQKMDPVEFANKMKAVLAQLDELAEDMDESTRTCGDCGLVVRTNMDDYQGKQAFEAAGTRVSKMYEKLVNGQWPGRSLVPVVDASTLREVDR